MLQYVYWVFTKILQCYFLGTRLLTVPINAYYINTVSVLKNKSMCHLWR